MDKRWILIIIIFAIGISGLYYTANESLKVGDAISTMNEVIVTMPQDFRIVEETLTHVGFQSRSNDEKIIIDTIKSNPDAYKLMKRDLAKLGTGNVKNTSEKLSDVTVYEIKNLDNRTIKYYFNKFNRTFKMESQHYKDTAKEKADVSYMIKGLSIDYKVKTS